MPRSFLLLLASLLIAGCLHANPLLADGGMLKVHIDRNSFKRTLHVDVGRLQDRNRTTWILSRKLVNPRSDVALRHLQPGDYLIRVHGTDPLEITGEDIHLAADEVREITFSISDGKVKGRFTLAGSPLAGALVAVQKPRTHWRSFLTTDSNGQVQSRSWTVGNVQLVISDGGLASRVMRRTELRDYTTFAIDLPDRIVSGEVVDPSGKPIPNANVFLTSDFEDHSFSVHFATRANGTFEYSAVLPGTHTVNATASNYLDSDDTDVDIEENEHEIHTTIVLEPARINPVTVVDSDGRPVSGALVSCVTKENLRSKATTNLSGQARISIPVSGSFLLVVFAQGSFAVARSNALQLTSRIMLPRANAALTFCTVTPDGKPVPSVSLLMRFDGELIPHTVIEEAERHKLFLSRTASDGQLRWDSVPRGLYEFWPYFTRDEADQITHSIFVTDAPIELRASEGENRVNLTLRERAHP